MFKSTLIASVILDLPSSLVPSRIDRSHESAAGLGQRSGRGGLSGLAAPQEGGTQLPGKQMEEILVRPDEEFSVLVHRQDGEPQPGWFSIEPHNLEVVTATDHVVNFHI